jgi:hypothetical protein
MNNTAKVHANNRDNCNLIIGNSSFKISIEHVVGVSKCHDRYPLSYFLIRLYYGFPGLSSRQNAQILGNFDCVSLYNLPIDFLPSVCYNGNSRRQGRRRRAKKRGLLQSS